MMTDPYKGEAAQLVGRLRLAPHPEGGYFRETYRSELHTPAPYCADGEVDPSRSLCTSIYFLLAGSDFSALHRLRCDELWYFHQGDPLAIEWIDSRGEACLAVLGDAGDGDACYQFTVPANTWFGSRLLNPHGFALVGCVTAPGFDFRDFEMGQRDRLLTDYPACHAMIRRLTRS